MTDPLYDKMAVIGCGLIGSSLAQFLGVSR